MIQLFNADCLERMKGIPDKSVDLIVTDPPYEVNTTGGGGTINTVKKLNQSLKVLDDMGISHGYDIRACGREFVRVLKKINLYVWCNKLQVPAYFDFYVNELGCKFDILCWHKDNALPTYSNKYLSDTEYCLYFRKGGYCNPRSYENAKTFVIEPINARDKAVYGHPTIKPVRMLMRFIENSTDVGDTVLDPFMGSGSTGVACQLLNRDFIGIEIDEKYFNVAKDRIRGDYQKEINLNENSPLFA